MGRPYSTRFIGQIVNVSRVNAQYVVPMGYRAIVRQITVTTNPTGTQLLTVHVQGPGVLFYLFQVQFSAFAMRNEAYHQVVNAGETITAFTDQGEAAMTISGYLLTE